MRSDFLFKEAGLAGAPGTFDGYRVAAVLVMKIAINLFDELFGRVVCWHCFAIPETFAGRDVCCYRVSHRIEVLRLSLGGPVNALSWWAQL